MVLRKGRGSIVSTDQPLSCWLSSGMVVRQTRRKPELRGENGVNDSHNGTFAELTPAFRPPALPWRLLRGGGKDERSRLSAAAAAAAARVHYMIERVQHVVHLLRCACLHRLVCVSVFLRMAPHQKPSIRKECTITIVQQGMCWDVSFMASANGPLRLANSAEEL